MFGYVRPAKADLKIKEFNRYRSVYCGLCKAIGQHFGQLPRLAVSYDMTFFALLLQAFKEEEPLVEGETCILHPRRKRPIAKEDPLIFFCAAATVILAELNLEDDLTDGDRPLKSRLALGVLSGAFERASRALPDFKAQASDRMAVFYRAEKAGDGGEATAAFGRFLALLFREGAVRCGLAEAEVEAMALVGSDLGRWIYLVDAVDDRKEDARQGKQNPLATLTAGLPPLPPEEEALLEAERPIQAADLDLRLIYKLKQLEHSIDRTLALMPYRRDGNLIANIAVAGLPLTRQLVLAEEALVKL